jgi:hemerythrin superfamily protein
MSNRMESPQSTIAKSKTAAVDARLDGLRGVFRTLAQQHREVATLLQRAKSTAAERRALWPQIRTALLSHERAEVREVYVVLRQHEATRVLAYHHDQEAEALEQLIERLTAMDIASPAAEPLFAELAATVMAHAIQEEQSIFPAAQSALGDARAEALEPALLSTQQQLERTV